jgi:curli biogenesis system outer membrane secretion channel CsgG
MLTQQIFVIALLGATAVCAHAENTLSVESFDDSAVQAGVRMVFGRHQDVGRGIQALLEQRLQNSGQFTLIKRDGTAEPTGRQDTFSAGTTGSTESNDTVWAKAADLKLTGRIVAFGPSQDRKFTLHGSPYNKRVTVMLDYSLVDLKASRLLLSGKAVGNSERSVRGFAESLPAGMMGVPDEIDMTGERFAETMIGAACIDAVIDLLAQVYQSPLSAHAQAHP